jgi:hypothetical protein
MLRDEGHSFVLYQPCEKTRMKDGSKIAAHRRLCASAHQEPA